MTEINAASAATGSACPNDAGSFLAEATDASVTLLNVKQRLQMMLDEILAVEVKFAEIENYEAADRVTALSAIIMGLNDVDSFIDRAVSVLPETNNVRPLVLMADLAEEAGVETSEMIELYQGFTGHRHEYLDLQAFVGMLVKDRIAVAPIVNAHRAPKAKMSIADIDLNMQRLKLMRAQLERAHQELGDWSFSSDSSEPAGYKQTSPEDVAARKIAGERYAGPGRLTIRHGDFAFDIEGTPEFIAAVRSQLDAEHK